MNRFPAIGGMFTAAVAIWLAACPSNETKIIGEINDADETVRQRAAEALGELESEAALLALRRGIDDPSVRVRIAVIHSLAQRGGDGVVADLARFLTDDAGEVRRAAIEGLARQESDAATEQLQLLLDDEDHHNRRLARHALVARGITGEEQVRRQAALRRAPLVREISSRRWAVRLSAARSLADCADSEALPVLASLLEDGETQVAAAAAFGLGRAAGEGAPEPLVKALTSKRARVGQALLRGLLEAESLPDHDGLKQRICQSLDGQLMAEAARVVRAHSLSCSTAELEKGLQSDDARRRSRTAAALVLVAAGGAAEEGGSGGGPGGALWRQGEPGDLLAVATLPEQPEEVARARVAKEVRAYLDSSRRWIPRPEPEASPSEAPEKALDVGGREGEEAVKALLDHFPPRRGAWVELLPSPVAPERVALVLILAAEVGLAVDTALVSQLYRDAGHVEVKAATVGLLADPLQALEADEAEVQLAALEALGRKASQLDGSTKAKLAAFLPVKGGRLRGAAATTLARTGDGAALRPLLEAFKRWPQPATARALGVLGEKRAASTLRRALRDAEPAHTDYVVALLEALTRLGGRDDAEAILPWTSHPDAALRRAAVVAAGAIGGERLSVRVDERRHDFALAVRRAARAATKASASNATRAGAQ